MDLKDTSNIQENLLESTEKNKSNKDSIFLMINILFTIIAGMMINYFIAWGYLNIYITSYVRLTDPNITSNHINTLFSVFLFSQAPCLYIAKLIIDKVGYSKAIAISVFILSLACLVSSFANGYWLFFVGSIFFGFSYSMYVLSATKLMIIWMPNYIGLASGVGVCGFSLGVSFWGCLSQMIINPDNKPAEIVSQEGLRETRYFTHDIVKNLPHFYIVAFWISFCFSCILPFILTEKKESNKNSEPVLMKKKSVGEIQLHVLDVDNKKTHTCITYCHEDDHQEQLNKRYQNHKYSWEFISVCLCLGICFAEVEAYKNSKKIIGINQYEDAT